MIPWSPPSNKRRGNVTTNAKHVSINSEAEFWRNFTKLPGGCWEWPEQWRDKDGYGKVKYKGVWYRVHRLAYNLKHKQEPMPDHLLGMHVCDNPPCGNPDHISPGTQRDNMIDARLKGRKYVRRDGASGEEPNRTVLE